MSVSISLNHSEIDRLLDSLEKLEKSASELRQILGQNISSSSMKNEAKQTKYSSPPARSAVPDISKVKWKLKGGADADPYAEFAYAFTSDQKGKSYAEVEPILEYLKTNGGKSTLDGYELTVSQNGKFLNRTQPKK